MGGCASYPWLSGCPKAKLLNPGSSPVSQRNESLRGLYVNPVKQKYCCFIRAASPQPTPGTTARVWHPNLVSLSSVRKHYNSLTFIWVTKVENYQSRSFVSQSQCWWPRCLSPADWDKRPGCPEPSDCGCELEYPLVPKQKKRSHWKQSESLYM